MKRDKTQLLDTEKVLQKLLASDESSIRFLIRTRVLREKPSSAAIKTLQQEIKESARVKTLLSRRDAEGRIPPFHHTYRKWAGAHWVLVSLAEIGYPPGDASLIPLRDQVYEFWLNEQHLASVPIIEGCARRCGSQQGNALFSSLRLGLTDARTDRLAQLLMQWQWPDGGWNCDMKPQAAKSSFWESLIPMRALSLYAQTTGNNKAKAAVKKVAEVFLKRHLFKRIKDGKIMNQQFIKLHYPCYWRYDILYALKVMAEAGFLGDSRCKEALDLLETKRLSDGGWPAEEKFYRLSKEKFTGGFEMVNWGGVSTRRMNEWVTADALYVLESAGRIAKK